MNVEQALAETPSANPDVNGIVIKTDADFKAIEFGLVVQGHNITCMLNVEEAVRLSEALVQAIENVIKPSCETDEA